MSKTRGTNTMRILLTSLAIVLATVSAKALPLTNPLSADQVTCDEIQLEKLALRTAIVEATAGSGVTGFEHPSAFLWRSPQGGSFFGLGVEDGVGGPPGSLKRSETQLSLDLSLRATADPLNPARPLLPQASLVVRDIDSNLVNPSPGAQYLTVTVALEPAAQNPFSPLIPLLVNNLTAASDGEQPATHADAAGRGVTQDGLTTSCESALTDFDQRIFTILSRTVRLSQCGVRGPCNPDGSAYNVTLFRGADPQTYRANVYFYAEACETTCSYGVVSKVAWEFKMNWDAQGKLTSGTVTVLPPCPNGPAPGCSDRQGNGTPMFILPPLWAGHARQGQHSFKIGTLVWDDFPGSSNNILSATINWQALLANSAWN